MSADIAGCLPDARLEAALESFSQHLKDEPGAIAAIKVLIELIQTSEGALVRNASSSARFQIPTAPMLLCRQSTSPG